MKLNPKKLLQDIIAYQKALRGSGKAGRCGAEAIKRCYHYQSKGWDYRLCHGRYRKSSGEEVPHTWCEYLDPKTGKWLVDDPAQRIKGWPLSACKNHIFVWDGKPDYA